MRESEEGVSERKTDDWPWLWVWGQEFVVLAGNDSEGSLLAGRRRMDSFIHTY